MTTLSKVLPDHLKKAKCSQIIHSGSCTANLIYQFHRCLISNTKYYAPIIALPLLAKFRNLNREVFKESLRYYLECVLTGSSVGWTSEVLICLFRNILGQFKTYTFLFVPSLISGLLVYLSSNRVQRLHMVSIFQTALETFLIQRKNLFTRIIANSILLQTLLFMSASSLILHSKQNGLYKGFWLLIPDKSPLSYESNDQEINSEIVTAEEPQGICSHEDSCTLHLVKGVRSYFAFGITIDFLKILIKSVPKGTVGFWKKLFAKLKNFEMNSAALLTSYIGIYRFTYCYLNNKSNTNLPMNHIIAGFLGGFSYIFMPKLTWLSYTLVIGIQVLWEQFKVKNSEKSKNSKFWNSLLKVPFGKIYFPFCLAYLIHNYCLSFDEISTLGQIIIDNTTDYYSYKIRSNVMAIK